MANTATDVMAPSSSTPPAGSSDAEGTTTADMTNKLRPASILSLEEAVHRDPTSLTVWERYIDYARTHDHSASPSAAASSTFAVYERALANLPGSYKLWYGYCIAFEDASRNFHPLHPIHTALESVHFRAARALPRSPVLWAMLLVALLRRGRLRAVETAMNEALQALPVAQHMHVWRVFHNHNNNSELKNEDDDDEEDGDNAGGNKEQPFRQQWPWLWASLCERQCTVFPSIAAMDAVQALVATRQFARAQALAVRLVVRDRRFRPAAGVARAQLSAAAGGGAAVHFLLGCVHRLRRRRRREQSEQQPYYDGHEHEDDHITKQAGHDDDDGDTIRPRGLSDADERREVEQADAFYAALITAAASGHARMAAFDRARAVFERGMHFADTAREFTVIFDAYARLERTLAEAMISSSSSSPSSSSSAAAAAEAQLRRLEVLASRRPFLLSDVQLRQNPHNVGEWLRRIRLVARHNNNDHGKAVVDAYTMAVRTIDPTRAVNGRASAPWLAFADMYARAGDIASARQVLTAAVSMTPKGAASFGSMAPSESEPETAATTTSFKFASVVDVALLWAGMAEVDLQDGDLAKAHATLCDGVTAVDAWFHQQQQQHEQQPQRQKNQNKPPERRWAVRFLWLMRVDVAHALDDADRVHHAHVSMLHAHIASAASVLSGTAFFEQRRLFARALHLYDAATQHDALSWPSALVVWRRYFTLAVARYARNRPDRVRDVFETALLRLQGEGGRSSIRVVAGGGRAQSDNNMVLHDEDNVQKDGNRRRKIRGKRQRNENLMQMYAMVKHVYLEYIQFELRFGNSPRMALDVIKRACADPRIISSNNSSSSSATVEHDSGDRDRDRDRADLFRMAVVHTAELCGAPACREVYTDAVTTLVDVDDVAEFGARLALLEHRLGEVQRARSVYMHVARVVDPPTTTSSSPLTGGSGSNNRPINNAVQRLWAQWEEFEREVGDVEDFKEMMRLRRRVEMDFARRADAVAVAVRRRRSMEGVGSGASRGDEEGDGDGEVSGSGAGTLRNMVHGGQLNGSDDDDDRNDDEHDNGGNEDDAIDHRAADGDGDDISTEQADDGVKDKDVGEKKKPEVEKDKDASGHNVNDSDGDDNGDDDDDDIGGMQFDHQDGGDSGDDEIEIISEVVPE